jgi:hypothetical protein
MKSKEEIEHLAENIYREYPSNPLDKPEWHYNKDVNCHRKRKAFVKGYTQCQEDMADIIKQAIEYGYQLRCNHKPINSGIDWVKEFNSLNKQD